MPCTLELAGETTPASGGPVGEVFRNQRSTAIDNTET